MKDIKISIIVPVYKIEETLLRQCLKSLVQQEERNVEFIVVDDGSPDNCGEIIDEYAKLDSRIIALHTENLGVSNARNVGIDCAKGEYIIFVDGDDYVEPDLCSRVMDAVRQAGTDILFFMHQSTDKDNMALQNNADNSIEVLNDEILKKLTIGVVSQENFLDGVWAGPPWGKVFRSSIIKENHLQFVVGLRKSQDRVFVLDYLLHVKSAAVYRYIGYHYVINETSVCQRYNKDIEDILNMAGEEFEKREELVPWKNEYRRAINTMYMIFFCECMLLDIFNRDNSNDFGTKMKKMKNLLKDEKYKNGLKFGNVNALSRKRRLMVFAARYKMYLLSGILSAVLFR